MKLVRNALFGFVGDLWCNSATYGGLGSCSALSAASGPCWFAFNCLDGNFCSGANFVSNIKGVCVPQKAVGQNCTVTSSDECVKGAYCNNGVCASKKAQGQMCAGTQECGAHLTCSTTCQPDACYDPTP